MSSALAYAPSKFRTPTIACDDACRFQVVVSMSNCKSFCLHLPAVCPSLMGIFAIKSSRNERKHGRNHLMIRRRTRTCNLLVYTLQWDTNLIEIFSNISGTSFSARLVAMKKEKARFQCQVQRTEHLRGKYPARRSNTRALSSMRKSSPEKATITLALAGNLEHHSRIFSRLVFCYKGTLIWTFSSLSCKDWWAHLALDMYSPRFLSHLQCFLRDRQSAPEVVRDQQWIRLGRE